MAVSTVNGKSLLSCDITMPYVGTWHADISADAEALTGKATITIEGVTFVGTVLRAGAHGGRLGARVVGGNGGLSKELPAKDYAGPSGTKVSMVLADILRESGETLSTTSDKTVLGHVLPKYHRIAGTASHAILRLTDEVGASWRVLRDGTIWVGKQTWPEAKPKHVLIDEDWAAGISTIAPEKLDLEPGTTFKGQKIDTVVHRLGPNSLRTEAHQNSPGSALNKFLGYIRRHIDYSRQYPGKVAKQNADGTLQIVPDDESVKGSGLDRATYDTGIPGSTVTVAAGQRLTFGFHAGDPARAHVISWNAEGPPAQVAINKGTLNVARQGDMVAVQIPVLPVAPTGGFMISPTAMAPAPPPPGMVMATVYGLVSVGNPMTKA